MPVTVRILHDHGLVVVRYDGEATIEGTLAALTGAAADPAFAASRRHLIDMRDVTGYERDFARFFAMQAQFADHVPARAGDLLAVYIAPGRPAQEMAQMAARTWDGHTDVAIRIVADSGDAGDLLGLAPGLVEALLATPG